LAKVQLRSYDLAKSADIPATLISSTIAHGKLSIKMDTVESGFPLLRQFNVFGNSLRALSREQRVLSKEVG
jgi:hypothetical protein